MLTSFSTSEIDVTRHGMPTYSGKSGETRCFAECSPRRIRRPLSFSRARKQGARKKKPDNDHDDNGDDDDDDGNDATTTTTTYNDKISDREEDGDIIMQ